MSLWLLEEADRNSLAFSQVQFKRKHKSAMKKESLMHCSLTVCHVDCYTLGNLKNMLNLEKENYIFD